MYLPSTYILFKARTNKMSNDTSLMSRYCFKIDKSRFLDCHFRIIGIGFFLI